MPASTKEASTIWFFGLSGSGKSTLAQELKKNLETRDSQKKYLYLDGDTLRSGLNADLSFSQKDRSENIRRAAEIAKLFNQQGIPVISSFITPLNSQRKLIRQIIGPKFLHLIYLSADLKTCEKRDVKGLYLKARRGEIENFTGIDSLFENPQQDIFKIDTRSLNINNSLEKVLNFLKKRDSID